MKARSSEVELLRIFSIVLIVVTHLVVWGIGHTDNALPWQSDLSDFINQLIRWHVNVFVIITGYFGIKSRWSVIKIAFVSIFYTWFTDILQTIFFFEEFDPIDFLKSIFFITHNKYWFVQSYILLVLVSPLLNQLMKTNYISLLLTLLFIDCWCGFVHNEYISNGFGIIHFSTLYVLGGGDFYKELPMKILYIILLTLVILLAIYILYGKNVFSGSGYNNPILIGIAMVIFRIFIKFKFQSAWINKLAISSFPVYLIHD